MYSRWFHVAVVLLWLSAMSWLIVKKVLPPLLIGEPPSYQTILWAPERDPTVGWKIRLDRRELGWSLSETSRIPGGMTEVGSRVHLDELPMKPIRKLGGLLGIDTGNAAVVALVMDVETQLTIDSFGRLTHFRSDTRLNGSRDALVVDGAINDGRLKLAVHSPAFSLPPLEMVLPEDALLDDALSPQTYLPGLRRGQTWTVPVPNPAMALLKAPLGEAPLEVLQATVERTEPVDFDGRIEEVWLVVYRRDSGSALGSSEEPQGKLWVRRDGAVLKQQATFLGQKITFVRMSDDELARLQSELATDGDEEP
ncbi:MAG: hypothetical protein HQ567_11435 [Candidatus Nealsonbacteria bacterium]|nr:hypothetical protein [Candidatus Nealsonbacteria bacterium]